jgi:predicted ATP-grasp superfamily ATP-dependent carboligase
LKNVLAFPCGSEIGLEVNNALADSKHFTLYGANSIDDHGKFVYRNYIPHIPFVDDLKFIDSIAKTIATYNIDFVIPCHDSVVLKMAENQHLLDATVITSCVETCRICRSKRKTYELFEKLIPTPKVYTSNVVFPVFLKPDVGQGSKGTHKADTLEQLNFYLRESSLVLEYLPGKEYTVDCFTDRKRKLLFCEGRERARTNNGISTNSKKKVDIRFQEIADIINTTLHFQGAWFFQLKERVDHQLVLMEIAPRIAATSATFRVDGVNFVQLSLFDKMGLDLSILYNHLDIEIDRAWFSRFSINLDYNYVYIDFDDTIVISNLVNTNVMKLLYQLRNTGKKIVLLSRHSQDINESLSRYAISASLFDKIIILNKGEKKSDYITDNSIFIDDSFAERKEVSDKLHIPVFSPDAVESLLYWKK